MRWYVCPAGCLVARTASVGNGIRRRCHFLAEHQYSAAGQSQAGEQTIEGSLRDSVSRFACDQIKDEFIEEARWALRRLGDHIGGPLGSVSAVRNGGLADSVLGDLVGSLAVGNWGES